MWPVARRIGAPSTPTSPLAYAVEPPPKPTVAEHRPVSKPAGEITQQAGSVAELARYASRLLSASTASPSSVEVPWGPHASEDGLGVVGEGGGLSGCREAVEVLTRNLKKGLYACSLQQMTLKPI
jgi:hypothetical protein